MPDRPIRISEWATVSVEDVLLPEQREAVAAASDAWRVANAMNVSPLSFSGPKGDRLCAYQYVGVVEVEGICIEIYPKLDRHLLNSDLIESDAHANSVMQNLMWMLEVSGYMNISEVDTAHLLEHSVSFYDVFAYLMAKNLLDELGTGVPHAYVTTQDLVRAVKGRINIREQVTSHWNRLDRIACIWDEFTADIPLNRLFKCACRMLNERVSNPVVSQLLVDCLAHLDQVEDVAPEAALRAVEFFRWDRSNERLKMCFDMAVRLLAGTGYNAGRGESDTFVFLIDMNLLFEAYAARIIEAHFGVSVETQRPIGSLFEPPQSLSQRPDFLWEMGKQHWIGDAKYKHMAKGQEECLVFSDIEPDSDAVESTRVRVNKVLSTNDARQLIVYSALLRQEEKLSNPPAVAIFYPFIGTGELKAAKSKAFTKAEFLMVPVWLKRESNNGKYIPTF